MEQARTSCLSPRLSSVPGPWPRRESPGAGSEEVGAAREGAGMPFSDHRPLLLGHAHLGGVQAVLGDVVLQGSRVAVASRTECQAPGGAHSAVLLDIMEALQHL